LSLIQNDLKKWAYVHIPKTGGTSISNILNKEDGSFKVTGHDSVDLFKNLHNYYKFTFVRNPYSRFISTYYHECRKVNDTITLTNFVKKITDNDILYLSQSYYIDRKIENFSKIGKYENYVNDLHGILQDLNIQSEIPHLNRNPLYDKHPELNSEKLYFQILKQESYVVDFIKERYEDDFKIFHYDMDI